MRELNSKEVEMVSGGFDFISFEGAVLGGGIAGALNAGAKGARMGAVLGPKGALGGALLGGIGYTGAQVWTSIRSR